MVGGYTECGRSITTELRNDDLDRGLSWQDSYGFKPRDRGFLLLIQTITAAVKLRSTSTDCPQ